MKTIAGLIIKIFIDSKKSNKEVQAFIKDLDKLDQGTKQSGKSIGSMFGGIKASIAGVVGVVVAVGAALRTVIKNASAFQEANSKFNVVFAGMEKQARSWRTELTQGYAMSTTEATKFLSSTQDLLVPMGMAQKQAAGMSFEVAKLSADLGSFNDQPTAQVMDDIQSALVGNFETMKKYGVVLNEARVKQEAMNQGLYSGKGNIDAAARAQAAYSLIVKGSQAAVGDMARTQDSFANTQKRLDAATEDLSLKFGAVFLPIATKVLTAIVDIIDYLGAQNIGGVLHASWEILSDFVKRLWNVVSNVAEAFYEIFSGNFDAAREHGKKAIEAIVSDWDKSVDNVVEAWDEGGRQFESFMEGQKQAANDTAKALTENEKQITAEQLKEIEKRKQAVQDYWDTVADNIEKYKQSKADELEFTIENEYAKFEYMYETNRLAHDDYMQILTNQIETARILYGRESIEYMKLLDHRLKLQKAYTKNKEKLDNTAAQNTINSMANLMGAAQGVHEGLFHIGKATAYAQAVVDTYAAANKALATYPPPWGAIAAGASIASGLLNVAKITATKWERRAEGGYLGNEIRTLAKANFGGGENRLIIANNKEFLVKASQTQANRGLLELINRTSGRVNLAQAAAANGGSVPTSPIIVQSEQNFDPLIDAMHDIVEKVASEVDHMNFYRKTFPKYQKAEAERTF